ncbi:unnamed protein product [Ranitomeya imitator]|uniref:Uncharacterized protein n=1 Tax=Ranitomeya imitator TaxID=111125 RepID=A0ABN9KYS8_9NEOB|nr:unnamed protein product [Ranitomeya imitator]
MCEPHQSRCRILQRNPRQVMSPLSAPTESMSTETYVYDDATGSTILSKIKTKTDFLHLPSKDAKSRDWEKERKRLIGYDLHCATLGEYHRQGKIPRGLRCNLRPTLFSENEKYCATFQKILNKCSFDIILLTIEYLQEAIKTTEEKIESIETQLTSTLSSTEFTTLKELKVLNMGLSFCPTPKWDSFQLERDLQQFYRNIRLKVYFEESTNSFRPVSTPAQTEGSILTIDQLGLRNRSTFIPPKSSHAVETFVNLLDRDVKRTLHDQRLGFLPVRHNLDSLEKQALDSLSENKNIVIKPADKGGAIVVMDRSFYMTEVRRQLSDTSTYKMVQTDPTYSIQQKIRRVLDKHLQLNTIDNKTKVYLTNNHPVTPVIYILPKIHKNLQNPPGRPIVASTDSILNPLSMFLEKLLMPHTKLTKSFILDTGDFLKKIRNIDIIPHNSELTHCTYSLYRAHYLDAPTESMSTETYVYDDATGSTILSKIKTKTDFLHLPSKDAKSRDWEKERKRLIGYDLHCATLGEYHRQGKIPRGLRCNLRPTLFSENEKYCATFQKILNKCSFDIILLTIEYLQEAIKTTEEKIESIETQLTSTLSSTEFTTLKELKVLNMGLSFCPTPKWDSFQLERDLQQFYRNIRLKVYFEESTNSFRPVSTPAQTEGSILTIDQLGLRNRSTFIPPKSSHAVETFVNLLDRDVKRTLHDQRLGFLPVRHNLDSLEKQALDSLSENKNIVIKPADKGGAIVVMDRSFYMTEVRRQLSDTSTYKMVQTDPTYSIQQKIRRVLDKHLQLNTIDNKTKVYLTNNHPVTPVIYILPKIHKNLQNPPGRPIVASTDSILNPLSMFLEKLLMPHTKLTKSFILDTGDFLKKIRNIDIIPHNSELTHCTYSLYRAHYLDGNIGGLSTALQNAVDKPLMPVGLPHPRFSG